MPRVLLVPCGSHGDVHPYIALGLALQARGHSITLITAEPFRMLAERHSFGFAPVGTAQDFEDTINDPGLWQPMRSLQVLFGGDRFHRALRDTVRHITENIVPGETVVLAGSLALGARIAEDKLGVPSATVHLQPLAHPSVASPALYPSLRMRSWWPRWLVRAVYAFGDRRVIDPILKPPINALRTELGLPSLRGIWGQWRQSPRRILCLFPAWYATAADWPAQTRQTGFLRYDQGEGDLPSEVQAFLDAGEPPVVISFGSAMRQGRPYFEAAAEACRRLGRRGIILARNGEQIPKSLPPGVVQFDYAPFSRVFPQAAAVIHHGGIGTCAQALAAGVPQLIMSLSFDQPDNAERLVTLGVARTVPATRFTAARATAALQSLLSDEHVPGACRAVAERMALEDPLAETCRWVEELLSPG